MHSNQESRTWLEISLPAAQKNVEFVKKHLQDNCQIAAVVKADAYGLGANVLAKAFLQAGCSYLIVACIDEGLALREAGIEAPILLLSETSSLRYEEGIRADLIYTISSLREAMALAKASEAQSKRTKVHVNIDTGMGRLGFPFHIPEILEAVEWIANCPFLRLEGVYTHFATADGYSVREDAESYFYTQLNRFQEVKKAIEQLQVHVQIYHCANSASTIVYPESQMDMVRAGLVLYGVASENMPDKEELESVFSLKSHVLLTKTLEAGESSSYGRLFMAEKSRTIAIVPIGYADGYRRNMRLQAEMILHGKRVPVVGNITMDQCMLDCTEVSDVQEGDLVTVLGYSDAKVKSQDSENYIPVEEMAVWQDTIPYEVLTSFSKRLPRVYLEK